MRISSPQELGSFIRQRRKDQGLTQEALADRIGATRQWVRMLEQGKPRLELGLTLRALTALGLGIDVQDVRAVRKSREIPTPVPVDVDAGPAMTDASDSTSPRRIRTAVGRYVDIDAVIDAARGPRR